MSKLKDLSNITFNIRFINSQRGFVKNGMNQLKPKMHGVRAIYKFQKLQMTTWLNKFFWKCTKLAMLAFKALKEIAKINSAKKLPLGWIELGTSSTILSVFWNMSLYWLANF